MYCHIKVQFTSIATSKSLKNVREGETLYKQFVEKWLIEHSKALFDTLTKRNKKDPTGLSGKPIDVEKDNVKALKYINIAKTRN